MKKTLLYVFSLLCLTLTLCCSSGGIIQSQWTTNPPATLLDGGVVYNLDINKSTNGVLVNITNVLSLLHGIATPDATGTNVFVNCNSTNAGGRIIYWDYSATKNLNVCPTNIFPGAQFSLGILAANDCIVYMPVSWSYFSSTNLPITNNYYCITLKQGKFARVSWMTNQYNQEASWQSYLP